MPIRFKRDPDLALDEAIARHRRELARLEDAAVRPQLAAWRRSRRAVRLAQIRLQKLLEQAAEDATPVSPTWLRQQERYRILMREMEAQIDLLTGAASQATRRLEADAGLLARSQIAAELALTVDAGFAVLPARQVETMVGMLRNGAPLADLFQEVGPKVLGQARGILLDGLALGKNPRAVARELARLELADLPLWKCLRITRTETKRAYHEVRNETMRQNRDLLSGWLWMSSLKPNACPVCRALHGREFSVDEPFSPAHPSCTCAARMLPSYRAVPRTGVRRPGAEILAEQPEADQRRLLGPTRYELWRSGRVRLEDMVERTESVRWGPGYRLIPLSRLGT